MNQTFNSISGVSFTEGADGALEGRVLKAMTATVALAIVGSAMLAPWRVTLGLALGGVLSLLNYHWLRTSIAAFFNVTGNDRPRVQIWRYLVRYFVVGVAVFAAYQLRVVSLPATIVGLCSFVPAVFVEAVRQFYFAIIYREESF